MRLWLSKVFMDAGSGINLIYAKNPQGNAYLHGISQADGLLFSWNAPWKRQLPAGSNSTRRLLWQPLQLQAGKIGV
jgi:hypothetical protein